ncbi:MAG TPA: Ig-like domain-containing protein [Verrucomicrobiae bacterium]|nr:Ig-like domain-containing protein [Verrucomicrobiae bacterium]
MVTHRKLSFVGTGAASLALFLLLFLIRLSIQIQDQDQDPARPTPIVHARAVTKPADLNAARAESRPAASAATRTKPPWPALASPVLTNAPVSPDNPDSAFTRFANWLKRYLTAKPAERAALESEGIQLARERREALRQLIQSDPARALTLTVSAGARRNLPESITSLLEERVSGRGALDVFAALAEPGKEAEVRPTFRVATINGREYDAYVYGRRLGEPTRRNISLNGIAIDQTFAANESPLRILDAEETAALRAGPSEPVCAISGNSSTINQSQVVAEVDHQPVFLCGPTHAKALEEKLLAAEAAGDTGGGEGQVASSVRTEGTKKLLVIRVDFSDLSGVPVSDANAVAMISGVNAFYAEMSFGRAGFYASGAGSEVTPTYRMPQPASYYGPNNFYTQLRTDARNAAASDGYTLTDYDYDVICFGAVPGWGWAGLGYVGASGAWLRNAFSAGVAGHEIGHNFGLNHANFWDTSGQSVIGNGTSIEYGDILDTMGSASAGANHFNASYKRYLNWLQGNETLTVSNSGTYRIYAHDDTNTIGLRGLRIVRSSSTNYWVEFRQKFPGNRWLSSGAGIRWSGNGNEKSHLLDTTPGSPDGKNDAALVVGRTFSDYAAGIHITTLRKPGTTPESLDIVVNLGQFPGNANPTVSITASTNAVGIGSLVTFNAAATDANGDPLAYYWDFGDATFGTNGAAASKSWSTTGDYVVRCVVSDMKGGVGSSSVFVRVGSPSTYRVSGRVLHNGSPLQGVRMAASSTKMGYTDSDGTYTIAGLAAGTYAITPVLDGYTFSAAGFLNPVSVGPDAVAINFSSGSPGGPGSVTLTSPLGGAIYVAPASIFLAATASASSGQSVTKVEFFQGNSKLGEDLAAPYSYTWTPVSAGSYSLTARLTESGGQVVTSAPVSITVTVTAPSITAQPQNQTVTAGGSVTFDVTAIGGPPLSYQWRFGGANLPGANSASLSLFNVQMNQAGAYSVVVTNSAGSATSAAATLTVDCGYSLSANSASFDLDGGAGSVNVTSGGGCAWTVSGVPAWVTLASPANGSGNGTVSYTVAPNEGSARSVTLTIAGHPYGISQGGPDLTPPSVAITTPAANATFTNTTITVTGSASDNVGVARVECRVGSGTFTLATGTANWSSSLALTPGTNVISARSVDLTGNTSATNTRTIFCAVPGTLNLDIQGKGSVKGGTNGQKLDIGRPYRLKATPNVGFVFSNWTGDVSSDSPELSFVMQSNVTLSANFVTNPFVRVKGAFNGLFYDTNEVNLASSGFFTVKLTDRGTYSAKLTMGKKRLSTSGRLDLEGHATNQMIRPDLNAVTVRWTVDLHGSDQINGNVTDGLWTADLAGDRAVFTHTQPASQAGSYTLVLLGSPGSAFAPGGDSYGTVVVDALGNVKLKAYLADQSTIATKVFLSKHGHWPLYAPLYGGQGAILGWINFADQPTTDFSGVVNWTKPAMPTSHYYPGGFTSEAALLGSRYTRPPDHVTPILNVGNALLTLTGGNMAQPEVDNLTLGLDSKVSNLGPDDVTMLFNLSSGLFTGHCSPPSGGAGLNFKGVVLQKANNASGHFLGTNQSGQVTFVEH